LGLNRPSLATLVARAIIGSKWLPIV